MDFIILAQVTDDVLSGFIDQIPTSLVMMVCGSGLLLFVAFAWFAYFKPLRKNRQAQKASIPAQTPLEPKPIVNPVSVLEPLVDLHIDDDDDLPDLDLLLGEEPATPFIEPEPEPFIPPAPVVVPPVIAESVSAIDVSIPKLHTGHRFAGEPVLNIMRDQRDGRLVVVMDGVGYRSLAEHEALKKQFIDIMRDLNQVVTKPDNNPPTGEPEPTFTPAYNPVPVIPNDQIPGKLPSFKLEDNMIPTNKGSYEVTAVPELNLAEAIEAYLQHKIRSTPEYRGRVIHVLPAIGGGVRIQVDQEYYEAVSDVADADVRGFIQQAIQEWQQLNS